MTTRFNSFAFCVVLATSILQASMLMAGDTKPSPPGPIPNQILTAKKIFIANAGGDERSREEPYFSGGPDRSYNQFFAAMKSQGRYELVGSPAEADLLFEIRFSVPAIDRQVVRGDTLGSASVDPQFRLEIRDPKTNALLWAFTEHVQWAILEGNRDRNFDLASARIVTDVQGLAARSVAVANDVKP